MRDVPLILVVDDQPDNREILRARLESQDYAVALAEDGRDALGQVAALTPDLILLDVMMPGIDGFEVCRQLRAEPDVPFIPIVLVTALGDVKDMVTGLEAGANDYLTKPVETAALTARVRSMLRIKALHDEVAGQRAELARWNSALEEKVAEQVAEIERAGRLRRYLPRQVADRILSAGAEEAVLSSQRVELAVLFADLRGFTRFSEANPPERIMAALKAFHAHAGPRIEAREGTLERFLGDGLVVLFGAPLPCQDPVARAVGLARDLHDGFAGAMAGFAEGAGGAPGLGVGIAFGTATVGQIGFETRLDYAAIGAVPNLAARLCDMAAPGQTLLNAAAAHALSGDTPSLSDLGDHQIRGLSRPERVWALG